MYILGINAAFHDSAAALLYNGQLVAAAEEERFTGIKHGKRPIPFSTYELPFHAIYFCLEKAGIHLRDVDHIAYSFDPALLEDEQEGIDLHEKQAGNNEPLDFKKIFMEEDPASDRFEKAEDWKDIEANNNDEMGIGANEIAASTKTHVRARVAKAPAPLKEEKSGHKFLAAKPGISLDRLFMESIRRAPFHLISGWPLYLQDRYLGSKITDWEWHFVEHHLAHAASAFYPSPFDRAAVMTLDGRGERCTATFNVGKDQELIRFHEVHFPDSLGLLYEKVTSYLGFLHSSDEYKVMALASYGEPVYEKAFKQMLSITAPGTFKTSWENLEATFGQPRLKNEPLTMFHFNVARSLQKVLEDTVIELCRWAREETGEKNLCLAGGIALNCVLNGKIEALSGFEQIWVQPASGDDGTSLGAALAIQADLQPENARVFKMTHAFLGPGFSDEQIESVLINAKISFKKMENIADTVSDLLIEDKMIGWFQGAMEFGPRALGHRSILASPLHADMQKKLNQLKDREDFRPVAPAVLAEDVHDWFENARPSPFMLFVYKVKPERQNEIPAVTHVDGTARIQTVSADVSNNGLSGERAEDNNVNAAYYNLLKAFKEKTGVPILINTSFNTLGRPIVCSPKDALECFYCSPLDALVMGPYLIEK